MTRAERPRRGHGPIRRASRRACDRPPRRRLRSRRLCETGVLSRGTRSCSRLPIGYPVSRSSRSIVSPGPVMQALLPARNAEVVASDHLTHRSSGRCGLERWLAPNPRPRPKAGRSLRKSAAAQRGYSVREIARRTGISKSHVHDISTGKRGVSTARATAATEQLSRERPALAIIDGQIRAVDPVSRTIDRKSGDTCAPFRTRGGPAIFANSPSVQAYGPQNQRG